MCGQVMVKRHAGIRPTQPPPQRGTRRGWWGRCWGGPRGGGRPGARLPPSVSSALSSPPRADARARPCRSSALKKATPAPAGRLRPSRRGRRRRGAGGGGRRWVGCLSLGEGSAGPERGPDDAAPHPPPPPSHNSNSNSDNPAVGACRRRRRRRKRACSSWTPTRSWRTARASARWRKSWSPCPRSSRRSRTRSPRGARGHARGGARREPTDEAVRPASRATGDAHSLSTADVRLMALAYTEAERRRRTRSVPVPLRGQKERRAEERSCRAGAPASTPASGRSSTP